MGLLRIYLALCVVAAHAGVNLLPWPMHSSVEAVQIFFLISGFYMSLISTKYRSAIEFYTSRFLRIFVPYYTILGLALLAITITGSISGNWLDLAPYLAYSPQKNGLLGVVFTAATNLTIFFQDWVMFLKHDPRQAFSFTGNFMGDHHPLWHYLIIPQAWSIGVELTFYLFVPLLGRLKTRWLWMIAAISLGMRIYAYQVLHLTRDPFNYRFFPFELLLFVMGMISQRIYAATLAKKEQFQLKRLVHYLIFAAALVFCLYLAQKIPAHLQRLGVAKPYTTLISYAGWAVVIPILFHLTSRLKADRFIGELSYPVYLVHFTVLEIVNLILEKYSIPQSPLGVIGGLVSVLVAILLYVSIFRPFENKRQGLVKDLLQKWRTRPPKLQAEVEK
ncbi:MAG TPA: acyltransferase [Anaerolineales bacterium]|nr:acyltransferase [Anaerolineales bacterium]